MKVLTPKQAAALIGITESTLRFWRCNGKGPHFTKLSDSKQSGVRYDLADIEAWKAERKFASTSAATVNHPGKNCAALKIDRTGPACPKSRSYPEGGTRV